MPSADNAPTVDSIDSDFATLGAVHLDVTALDRALGFWRDLIGLHVLSTEDGGATVLGVPGRPLVVLHPGATAPLPRNYCGLHHLAIHVPTLEDFARVQARAESIAYPQFPTDHLTHYANYLDDEDGNGLELAFETLERVGPITGGFSYTDVDGDPIDLPWLRTFLPDGNLEPGMPDGAVLGHLHLRVSSMEETHAFYRDQIGFTPNMFSVELGMYDLSAGGSFPHRMAGNNWESGGRFQRPAGTAGLRYYTLVLRSPEALATTVSQVALDGGTVGQHGNATMVADPSGNRVLLKLADSTI